MNIARIKGLTWLGTLVVAGLLGWDVTQFLKHKADLERYVPEETLEGVLNDVEQPPPPKDNLVAYGTVLNVFRDFDWTGKAPPPKVVKDPQAQQQGPPKTPVSDILRVIVLQVDTRDPAGSLAYVHYTDARLSMYNDREHEDRILRVAEKLYSPYEHIEVKAITQEGVTFVFTNDPEREPEVVMSEEFDLGDRPGIVVVDNAVMPQTQSQIVRAAPRPFNPRETVLVRKNEYQVGVDDLQELNDDYSRILSQDLRYRTHRGRDGRVDGVQVTSVKPDSLPARHGVTGGEIIKSINGHPVKSVNEAIAFVKKEAEKTSTWVVVYEKQGKTYTRTYHSPED